MNFAEPRWLWLAFLGPLVLLGLQQYSAWARRKQLARIAAPHFVQELTRSHSPLRRAIKNILLILVVFGLGLALARPQWGQQENAGRVLGRDVVFLLDCSRSMLAADVAPSRLQRAKLAIMDYVQRHARGRVGLVAFAGQAFLQCPLTLDYGAFEDTLNTVSDKTIPVPGTDIGRALDEGFHAMEQSDKQKILVLLTDGEDLEKGGLQMAQTLAKKGIVVFTIGVGTPAGSEIHFVTEQGLPMLVRDKKGDTVLSRLDETTLTSIARATGGAYYPLGSLGEGLAKARLAVDALNTNKGTGPGQKFGVERFYIPIAIALVLLVIESLVGTRRGSL